RGVAEHTRDEGGHADVGAAALRRLHREARERQFADVEFGMTKGAEEDFFRRQGETGRLDTVDLHAAVDQRARTVIRADGNGEIELGHEESRLKNAGES